MLAQMDLGVEVLASNEVVLHGLDSSQARFLLHRLLRPPRTSEPLPDSALGLLITPHLSQTQRCRFADAGWSFVTGDGYASICFDSETVRLEPNSERSGEGTAQHRLFPPAMSRVAHALLNSPKASQTRIASDAGVSQPYVHAILRQLRASGQWMGHDDVVDRAGLLDLWLPKRRWEAITTYWVGATDLLEAVGVVDEHFGGSWLVSGDVAADVVAPWARPATLAVITGEGDLRNTPLVQVADGRQAQVILHVCSDPLVGAESRAATWNSHSLRLANTWQIAWDLEQSVAPDKEAALNRFLDQVLRQAADAAAMAASNSGTRSALPLF